jgi:CRISPR-associated protein Csx10
MAGAHDARPPGKIQVKPPKGGPFCVVECEEPEEIGEETKSETTLVGVERFDQVHITLEDVNRRGEGNQVFRYEALAPGQDFIGVIVAPEKEDLSEVRALLTEGDLLLGTAQFAGYGRVAVQLVDEVPGGWQECPSYTMPDGRLVVTLLSPAILRSNNGQIGWDSGRALAHNLGLSADVKLAAAFGKTTLMGGYNRKWSLPLPQAWALTAGSVFVFEAARVDRDALQRALDHGIGERRAEGFGRIAINWQTAATISRQPRETYDETETIVLSDTSKQLAREMAQRRLRAELDRALVQRVGLEAANVQDSPTNAQLSAIRQATLSGLTRQPRTMQPLLDYLSNLKEAARSQLERCRIGARRTRLLDWLKERARNLDVETQLLQGQSLPRVAGETATLTDDLRVEYTARLIDGLMQTLARQNKERKR